MSEFTQTSYTTKEIEAGVNMPCPTIPVTIASGLDLAKGTVLGRITASGLYGAYNDGNSDGTEVASGVLASAVNSSSTGQNRPVDSPMHIGGAFYEDQLVGVDAAAIVDLKARSVPGRNLFIF